MSTAVRPSSFAQDEIEYYLRRYESETVGLGGRLWQEIQAATTLISAYPEIGQLVPRTRGLVRRIPIRHFPFFLIYRRRDEHLQIVALAHTSRKPSYWRPRLSFD